VIPENKCGLNAATQEKLNSLFAKHSSIDAVILYGSRAKGSFKPGSDIDLMIKAAEMSLSDLFSLENEIDDLYLPYKVDISLFHQLENPNLIDHIQRVGIVFYKKS
jgi:predicted nucleotidyltransferase